MNRTRNNLLLLCAFVLIFVPSAGFGAAITVDFDDDPLMGDSFTCNPDFLSFECNPPHHDWLKSKGIDITGSPNGFVFSTQIGGDIASTGTIIGFTSPSFLEEHWGLGTGEVLAVHFLNGVVNFVEVTLVTAPSSVLDNIPTTVLMSAFDSSDTLIASTTKTFTGVTNGSFTPAKMNLSGTGIAKIALETSQHVYYGVFIEEVIFDSTPPPLEVAVDIKPGTNPNSINLCSNGAVPVAILGSATFAVVDVVTDSLRFAEAAVKVVGKKDPRTLCSYEDFNGDSFVDLICNYVTADLAAVDGESTSATVKGELVDGTSFEGTDSVNIVKYRCN
jgi:hypothetical protein